MEEPFARKDKQGLKLLPIISIIKRAKSIPLWTKRGGRAPASKYLPVATPFEICSRLWNEASFNDLKPPSRATTEHTSLPHDEGELNLEPMNLATSENLRNLRLSIPPRASTPGISHERNPPAEAVSLRKICGSARVDANLFSRSTTWPRRRKHRWYQQNTPLGIERPPTQVLFEFFQKYPRYMLVMVPSSTFHHPDRVIQMSITSPATAHHHHYHHYRTKRHLSFHVHITYADKATGAHCRAYRKRPVIGRFPYPIYRCMR